MKNTMIPLADSRPPVIPERLVQRCASGDEYAWEHLYARYESTARRFLQRMGVGSDSLDDACQEVFVEAFRFLPGFRGDCSFKTWLYRLCLTQARKVRKRERMRSVLWAVMMRQGTDVVTEGDLDGSRSRRLVERALDVLSDAERSTLVLYEFEGLSGKEIAEIEDCPETTVWRRLHYARKKFRAEVLGRGEMP